MSLERRRTIYNFITSMTEELYLADGVRESIGLVGVQAVAVASMMVQVENRREDDGVEG